LAGIGFPMTITKEQIKDVVLGENDFGHEMRVGRILDPANIKYPFEEYLRAWFKVPIQGGTYVDPVSKKPREFDFRSKILGGSLPSRESRIIHLALECKNLSDDCPIVVCGRPRARGESYHFHIGGEDGERKAHKVAGASSLYKESAFVGKSLLRLKRNSKSILIADNDAEIYDRWSQALASAHDLASEAVNMKSSPRSYAFIMPLVVVPDESLWQVAYHNTGTLEGDPVQVDQCEYYVAKEYSVGIPFIISHIHFVTMKGLEKMLSELANRESFKWDQIFAYSSTVMD